MKVVHFKGILINNGMQNIADLLSDEKRDDFMEYIHWRTQDRIHLNTPKEIPRWKIVAETYGFSTAEIDNFERVVEMYNLYSPTYAY